MRILVISTTTTGQKRCLNPSQLSPAFAEYAKNRDTDPITDSLDAPDFVPNGSHKVEVVQRYTLVSAGSTLREGVLQ